MHNCSKVMIGENGEALGTLEAYCCVSRAPYADQSQLIELAECLAAIAIQRHNETAQQSNCAMRDGDIRCYNSFCQLALSRPNRCLSGKQ